MTFRKALATLPVLAMILGLATLSPAQNSGVEKLSGTGLCQVFAAHDHRVPERHRGRIERPSQVFFMKANPLSKGFHGVVCKTSAPVAVEGRLIRNICPGG